MKLFGNAESALKQPDTRQKVFDMPPERKERMQKAAGEVVDLLTKNTEGPLEAYFVLHFALKAIEETQGIRGGLLVENDDTAH